MSTKNMISIIEQTKERYDQNKTNIACDRMSKKTGEGRTKLRRYTFRKFNSNQSVYHLLFLVTNVLILIQHWDRMKFFYIKVLFLSCMIVKLLISKTILFLEWKTCIWSYNIVTKILIAYFVVLASIQLFTYWFSFFSSFEWMR
jgi:hypothetical protein